MRFSNSAGIIWAAIVCLAAAREVAKPLNFADSKESRACGSRRCLPCERIEFTMATDGLLCSSINQDDTIHSVNDLFWAVAGNCKPQVTLTGDSPNPYSGKLSCFIDVKLPRAHKGVDWASVKHKALPGRATYFTTLDYKTAGSCWCELSESLNHTCKWDQE